MKILGTLLRVSEGLTRSLPYHHMKFSYTPIFMHHFNTVGPSEKDMGKIGFFCDFPFGLFDWILL